MKIGATRKGSTLREANWATMPSDFSRRTLLKMAGAATTGPMLSSRLFASQEPLVPADKKLTPEWLRSLTERGIPRIHRDPKELARIGMPVGGICCGQVYLSGDGRLWLWDIFGSPPDDPARTSGTHYANPMKSESKVDFEVRIAARPTSQPTGSFDFNPLDATFFDDVRFEGRYPSAGVRYRKPNYPLEVHLDATSPFVPLDVESSNLPVLRLRYRITNRGYDPVLVAMEAPLKNPVGQFSGYADSFEPFERELEGLSGNFFAARPRTIAGSKLAPIELANWKEGDYGGWIATGTAFGPGPVDRDKLPERLSPAKPKRQFFVNTHEARKGEDSPTADRHIGTLTSPKFTILRRYLNFWIGGGNHPGETCMNLVVEGKVVRTETGRNSSVLRAVSWDVSEFRHKEAHLEIVDRNQGGWGHVSIDWPLLSESPLPPPGPIERLPDFGSLAVAFRSPLPPAPEGGGEGVGGSGAPPSLLRSENASPSRLARKGAVGEGYLALTSSPQPPPSKEGDEQDNFPGVPANATFRLRPGETQSVDLFIAWHFPNYGDAHHELRAIQDFDKLKRHYAKDFKDAEAVLRHAIANEAKIFSAAERWTETWYDSTLPYWFLERTLLTADCLQTQTAHRFDNGRFYGWEGIYCCPGTCQHVWNYAQAAARLFPELERDVRERVDYGIAFQPDGTLWYRAESHHQIAHDGQAGTILRTWREHTTSPDDKFLRRVWPRVKKAIQRLIADDKGNDGILDGWQYNTLDTGWYGEIAWISSLYLAALQAGQAMADEMGDSVFRSELAEILEKGRRNLPERLFNGEYFIQKRDPAHLEAPGHGIGCHIDQVFGDSYLHQVGLEPVLDREKVRSALRSLWKYNFVPDAGDYRKKIAKVIGGGRWYAMDGEAGLLMTTFPKGGDKDAPGKGNPDWMVGYFNECMNGFEYQVAAHMIAEGMLTEGLAIVRSLEDRYAATKRNPYNEIECSDHYSRSMASYGAFLTICGFAFHGPRGFIRFAPKLNPENFRAAFTAAEGWGTYTQTIRKESGQNVLEASLTLKWGRLRLREIELAVPFGTRLARVTAAAGSRDLPVQVIPDAGRVRVRLPEVRLTESEPSLSLRIASA